MSSNKMIGLMKPLMRCSRNATQIGRQSMAGMTSRRQYWPARRDSWDPFTEVQRSMDRMFRDINRLSPLSRLWNNPFDDAFRNVPIETSKDGQRLYKIELSLPDFRPEDINVSIVDRNVTVKAKRESETNGCKQYREYSYQYTLPNEVDIEKIRSHLTDDGLLKIEAPLPQLKQEEAKEIPIQKEDKKELKG